ncbi:alpha/beta hydrolase [Aeromonas jandaei]|uniref:alpha/beta fold hydrolase n=1 Tax=Aeromonas jandaei TaxID=650 RepID=UPI001C5BC866|nr:alpha/beta fold hydrolase [Aeromonas jandaei]MBW3762808.1 alpha/beta hydrolase [Aeromonas jandaei]
MSSPLHYVLDGVHCEPHFFTVPLDHDDPDGESLTLFARTLCRKDRLDDKFPWLLFLQGGPGFGAPRPSANSGWLKRALEEFRVVLLDQRGTGMSSPIHSHTLAKMTPAEQAHYLSHFRADNIVRDAEFIRLELSPSHRWSLLGQSFGGFCCLTYLSLFPDSLREVYITGGIAPVGRSAEEVYRATYQRVADKNRAFFARFPHAQPIANRLANHLHQHDVRLPNGQRLTVEQFQQQGLDLGATGAFEELYYLLEEAFIGDKLSPAFLYQVQSMQPFNTNPLFAILHEAIYAEGEATRWAAARVREELPELNWTPGKDFAFTGEMIFPWMFEQFRELLPLKEAAHLLANKADWGPLYDPAQLARNKVPVACAVYAEDMYVEFDYSRETLRGLGSSRAWITNEYEHNGLRADGEVVLDKLIALNRDR